MNSWEPGPYGQMTLDEHEKFAKEELARLAEVDAPDFYEQREIKWNEWFLRQIDKERQQQKPEKRHDRETIQSSMEKSQASYNALIANKGRQ